MYIVCGNTDLRKGIDTLAILIADNFGLDLYDDSLFFDGSLWWLFALLVAVTAGLVIIKHHKGRKM